MLNKLKNNSGFTIVELLIVIVVIAILAAISIVAYNGVQTRGQNASADSIANQIAKKAEAYFTVNGSYPTTAANFNSTTSTESNLGSLKVTVATNLAPTAPTAATNFNNIASAYTQFTSGSRVIYNGSANGYVVTYKKDSGVATRSNGTAPSGTYAFGTNENL